MGNWWKRNTCLKECSYVYYTSQNHMLSYRNLVPVSLICDFFLFFFFVHEIWKCWPSWLFFSAYFSAFINHGRRITSKFLHPVAFITILSSSVRPLSEAAKSVAFSFCFNKSLNKLQKKGINVTRSTVFNEILKIMSRSLRKTYYKKKSREYSRKDTFPNASVTGRTAAWFTNRRLQ